MIGDPIQVALRVAEALDRCGIEYLVGGSLASSVSGEPRSTLDVDLVVAIGESVLHRGLLRRYVAAGAGEQLVEA